MDEFFPDIKSTFQTIILFGLCELIAYIFVRLRKRPINKLPQWVIYGLILYTVFSMSIALFQYYKFHKPLEVHRFEKFDYQTIILDGKSFDHCYFSNVKFIIKGVKKINVSACDGKNNEIVFTNRAAIGFSYLQDMRKSPQFSVLVDTFLLDLLNKRDLEWVKETSPDQLMKIFKKRRQATQEELLRNQIK